jgi:hypothetical protein
MTYTPPQYVAASDVEKRYGAVNVAQLFDDGGDGEADTDPLTFAIEEASGEADAFLLSAFPKVSIAQLSEDPRFRGAVCDLVMAIGGERRHEWMRVDGTYPHGDKRKRAKEMLKMLGQGLERLGAEETYGENPVRTGRTNVTLPAVHVFAISASNPRGRGGF